MKMLKRRRRRLRTGPPQNQLIAQYVGGHQIHTTGVTPDTPDTQNFDSVAVVAFDKIKDWSQAIASFFLEDKTIVICGYKLYHCEFY